MQGAAKSGTYATKPRAMCTHRHSNTTPTKLFGLLQEISEERQSKQANCIQSALVNSYIRETFITLFCIRYF